MQYNDENRGEEKTSGSEYVNLQLQKAFLLQQEGALLDAKALYADVLQCDPRNFDAIHMSAVILRRLESHQQSENMFIRAISIRCNFAPVYSNYGLLLKDLKRFEGAIICFENAISIKSDFHEAYYQQGLIFVSLKQHENAFLKFNKAIILKPDFIPAYQHLGNLFRQERKLIQALASYEKIILIRKSEAFAHSDFGVILKELGRLNEAILSYDTAIELSPYSAAAFVNRGNALTKLKRYEDAVSSYDAAIIIKPDYTDAYRNRGIALNEMRSHLEALGSFEKALAIRSDYAAAHNDRGNTLNLIGLLEESLSSYDMAATLNPDLLWLSGRRLQLRMKISKWAEYEQQLAKLETDILSGKKAATPFSVLGLIDNPMVQSIAARHFTERNFPSQVLSAPLKKANDQRRIRLGYFSADFRLHPMSQLMAGIFESHDRSKFEVIGFSFGLHDFDRMRERISASFDRFIDVHFMDDQAIAEMTRELGVDIAVDLTGFTAQGRPGVFACRCAPVQVSFLGYPGTMSADYIDYIVADDIVIPPESRVDYKEKIIYLPGSYYPNCYQLDTNRYILHDQGFTREQLGLPENSFVFCCFNNSYKITPPIFDSWMKILLSVEGSVLWLLDDNRSSVENLRREASQRGVSRDRIIFARRMPIEDHLARHRCADLFLDTLPYNAHTTGTDALWAGLPLLTRIGVSFAGRVAASLLNAVGLPELITHSISQYEELAILLGNDPDKMTVLKKKLANNKTSTRLFDMLSYLKHIETAYVVIHKRHLAGLEPDHVRCDC